MHHPRLKDPNAAAHITSIHWQHTASTDNIQHPLTTYVVLVLYKCHITWHYNLHTPVQLKHISAVIVITVTDCGPTMHACIRLCPPCASWVDSKIKGSSIKDFHKHDLLWTLPPLSALSAFHITLPIPLCKRSHPNQVLWSKHTNLLTLQG